MGLGLVSAHHHPPQARPTHIHVEPQPVTLAHISNRLQGVKGPQHGSARGGTNQEWHSTLWQKSG